MSAAAFLNAETARSSADVLLTILNDILAFSKTGQGEPDFEPLDFDLRTLCESTADLLEDAAQRKSLEIGYVLDAVIPPVLHGDPGRLRQVLLNLLSNAVKFTDEGGVLLQVDEVERTQESVLLQFRVTDTGVGLTAAKRESLFRRFGGTARGLAIAKQLVQLMGGEIGVESEEGCGSTFWFTARLGFRPADVESRAADAPHTPHVLVVEDSLASRHTIALQLAAWRVNCDTSDDGVSALAMMRARAVEGRPYDVVIADQRLPGIDGTTLVRLAVANRKDFGMSRFVLMTASPQQLDVATLSGLDVRVCLRKPVKPAFLYSAVFCPPAHVPPPLHGAGPRVLVADDNAVNQKVVLRQLQRLGFEADAAGSGIEVLEAMHRISYDLVLMDCQMPEMDGYQTTAHLRRLEKNHGKRVPVIALTASDGERDRRTCVAVGMDDFLPKPVHEAELAAVLARWLPRPLIDEEKESA
jgi:two-component system, sensor histidine kinase and response regulator